MKYVTPFSILLLLIIVCPASFSQTLKRQALIDFSVKADKNASNPILFNKVPENSRIYNAGVRSGDRIILMDNVPISSPLVYQKQLRKLRGDVKTELTVNRDGKNVRISFIPDKKQQESIENCTTTYDEVVTKNGYPVRIIVTRPKNISGKLPVIFFVQWLSCDQVEINRSSMDGWAYLNEDLANKTGYVLIRTEKPGLGDSEGPDCSECDLQHEIDAYKASFSKMLNYDFVDKENVFVVGGSIGGALAPIVAEGQKIKGLISTGGFSTTWYEHILDFERTRLFYAGTKPDQIDSLVKKFSLFYHEYLFKKRKPSAIIETDPGYKSLWYQANDLQFGRPVKYYQQLQELNMSYYWNKINCPVLVVYGEYDWIMSRAEQENIAQLLNQKNPGSCKLAVIPGMNHHFSRYKNAQEAFDEPNINYEADAFKEMKNWIDKLVRNN